MKICRICNIRPVVHNQRRCKPCIYARQAELSRLRGLSEERKAKMRIVAQVTYEIKVGRIERKPCEVCWALPSQAHHDNYAKPLEIRWLCQAHHSALHVLLRQAARKGGPIPEKTLA